MGRTKKKTNAETEAKKPSRIGPAIGIKRGRISRDEDQQIAALLKENKTVEDIAEELRRPVTQIVNYCRKFYGKGLNEHLPAQAEQVAGYLRSLRSKSHWRYLKEHYSADELDFYEELYSQLMAQFKDDILPTEELQIFLAIDAFIMTNHHKKARKLVEDKIDEYEIQISLERKKMSPDMDKITALESQRQVLMSQSNVRTKEFTELAKRFDETIERLKGTREQRFRNVESSRQSWPALIKTMQDRKVRDKEGRQIAIWQKATDKAQEQLQQPYKYINGEYDQPFLSPENVLIKEAEDAPQAIEGS
jgi:hypothetical protein